MNKNFDNFFDNLKPTIMEVEDYVDYDKVFFNVNKNLKELELLNQILKSNNPVEELHKVLQEHPNVKSIIPNLIAIRGQIIRTIENEILINDQTSIEDIIEIIKKVGLVKFFQEKKITNIIDYLIGIEIGMDTNARKNRVGSLMEKKCQTILENKGIKFQKQVKVKNIEKIISNFDFAELLKGFGDESADKVFDFLIEFKDKYYLMEVNFYSSSGSKLNETVKSYMYLNDKIKSYKNIEFIWITDGFGWKKTRNQIREGYENIKYVFNLEEFESNSFAKLIGE